MSKASKTRRKMARQGQKRAQKAAKKRLYLQYAQSGENSKSLRYRRRISKGKKVGKSPHFQDCGNPGCGSCNGLLASKEILAARQFRGGVKLFKNELKPIS